MSTGSHLRGAGRAEARTARSYTAALLRTMPYESVRAFALMLLGSLTEWVGLLLLIPLLALTGVDLGGGAAGRIAEAIRGLFTALGLRPSVPLVLGLYVLVVSARTVLQRLQSVAIFDVQQGFVHHLRCRLYAAIANARWVYLSRIRSGDLLHSLVNQIFRIGVMANDVLSILATAIISVAYLGLAIKLSAAMTAIAFVSGGGLVLVLWRRAERSREAGELMSVRTRDLMGAITEHLGGIKTAKSYGVESRNVEIFAGLSGEVVRSQQSALQSFVWVKAWFQIGSVVTLSVVLYVALEFLKMAPAEILLLILIFARLVPRFSGIQESYQHFINGMPAFREVMDLVHACEAEAEQRSSDAAVGLPGLQESLRLEGVSFRYAAGSGAPTITRMDLAIPARSITAIVGPSGAGKSTIADLLLGLLTPDEGRIVMDGVPLRTEQLRGWREQIGYVPQDTFLFHDTVRANLLWARPQASETELFESLRLAAADEFVHRLPKGIDTVIGDRGVLVSGGERQRLALARALLRKPPLLVLDEATSALDSARERRIQRAVEGLQGSTTILIITHRLSTIRQADLIHVVEDGRLVESGGWDELLDKDGRFAALCRMQEIETGFRRGTLVPVERAAQRMVAT